MCSILQCMDCRQEYPIDSATYTCVKCGGLLDVQHDFSSLRSITPALFDSRLGMLDMPYKSGVWRYKELVYPGVDEALIVSKPEGNTNLYHTPILATWAGVSQLYLKHEGENPTGSFKDRGMTCGLTQARVLGMKHVACASTGNTSASMAAYAALAGCEGVVFFQNQQIALGKVSQAVAYGAICIQVDADFDRNMALVQEIARAMDIYVLNSVNPFRLEGQKTIIYEILQQLKWRVPDWIVVPGGNLGNTSAFGKALSELYGLGMIERLPRLAVIQAEGAAPLYRSYQPDSECREYRRGLDELLPVTARTIATAIKIGNPVNFPKAVRALRQTNGIVEVVSDQEIMDAKALIDRQGIGCEPASACVLAGVNKLVKQGVIQKDDMVVGVLTGHLLKDPGATIGYHQNSLEGLDANYANTMHQAQPDVDAIVKILDSVRAV